ncbi:MAG: hypothetical protein IIB22_07760, partial [Chloroflexi bacterium]|nr:hypothetical protein [Chloroflexota bacterium]
MNFKKGVVLPDETVTPVRVNFPRRCCLIASVVKSKLMEKLIGEYEIELVEPECAPGSARWAARVSLPNDISAVFPYLNALQANAWYNHESQVLILREPGQAYAFRPKEIRVARVSDPLQAKQLAGEVIE